MEFFVVTFENKQRVFTSLGDAKNCLGNLAGKNVHKGMITRYFGEEVGKIVGMSRNGKNIYSETAI